MVTVSRSAPDAASTRPQDDLRALVLAALSDPVGTEQAARSAIARGLDVTGASLAYQALGVALREHGDLVGAERALRRSLRAAAQAGDPDRQADVLASLGATLVWAGRTRAGLSRLEHALTLVDSPALRLGILVRRSQVNLTLGYPDRALADLGDLARPADATDAADTDTDTAGTFGTDDESRLWLGRALVNRCWAFAALGRLTEAAADAREAQRLLEAAGRGGEAARAVLNRAWIAYLGGDLPTALRLVDEAQQRYRHTDQPGYIPTIDRVRMLTAAGLLPEALAAAHDGVEDGLIPDRSRAELLLVTADLLIAVGDTERAGPLARRAHDLFHAQGRRPWQLRADLAIAKAGARSGTTDLSGARRLAAQLTERRSPDAIEAHLLVARLAQDRGDTRTRRRALAEVARARTARAPLDRSVGWLAQARLAADDGNRAAVLQACRRGVDAAEEHRALFGDHELRARSVGRLPELAELALLAARDTGDARTLLVWSERLRAGALAAPLSRPADDPDLARHLAAAREADRRLGSDGLDPGTLTRLRRERDQHQEAVRRRYRHQGSAARPFTPGSQRSQARAQLGDALDLLGGDAAMITLVPVGEVLYALVLAGGRVRRVEIGPLARALADLEFARFALRRAAFGRRWDPAAIGAGLQASLFGNLGPGLPGRVLVVPPASLYPTPWGVLPAFADRVVSVEPTLARWVHRAGAARDRVRRGGPAVFIAGPGLADADAEVAELGSYRPGSTVLTGASATVAAARAALDGAGLAHLAAHGTFRADAPLFSALQLADGPLYLHDLDGLARAPETVVLSACDAGDSVQAGVDDALGLTTGLIVRGTGAVFASTTPVADAMTRRVMVGLHEDLASGVDLATAWLMARRRWRSDPAAFAIPAAFVGWCADRR